MTKVSVFGQQPTETKELKKIKFVKRLYSDCIISTSTLSPKDWNNVMLYRKSTNRDSFDIILAWDDGGENAIFLGHWNDGVV